MKKLIVIFLQILTISTYLCAQAAGNAIRLDGIDDYMLVPHHQSLNPGEGSWTISLWVKTPNITQRGQLVGKRLPVNGYNQYTFGIGNNDPHYPNPGKTLYFNYIDSAGVSERSGHLQDEFVDGNWHHLALVADKIVDSVFIYIDGVKRVTIMQYNYGGWPSVGRLDSLLVARNSDGSHYLEGEMDELSLWSKALSQTQINVVMSDTLSFAYYSTADSGLVGYWRFDEYENLGIGSGIDDIRDFSVWGNHGGTEGLPLLVPSGILLDVENTEYSLPKSFSLFQNYPNPFNPSTKIKFTVPQDVRRETREVTLKVYDILGSEVATLVDEELLAGEYEVEFNGYGLTSDVYFYQLVAGNFTKTKKMILLR